MTTTDPLGELATFDDDGVPSFKFEAKGDTVEGTITDVANGWTAPKPNKWGNLMSYLPLTIRTAEGDEWRLWPTAQVYEDSGNRVPKEFTRTLVAAVKASGSTLQVGGTLKVRYDGLIERTNKAGVVFEVGTYTMRYVAPSPLDADDLADIGF